MPQQITRRRCAGAAKPCKNWAVRHDTFERWHEEQKITAEEARWLRAAKPMCLWCSMNWLESINRGAKRRLLGDAFKGWKRNFTDGFRALQAMCRAGLVKSPGAPPVLPNEQCSAHSKRTKLRCRARRHPGSNVCRWHGALGKGPWNAWKRGDPRLAARKRRKAEKLEATLRKMAERERRRREGMLMPHVGFRSRPEQPEAPLWDQFRQGTGRK